MGFTLSCVITPYKTQWCAHKRSFTGYFIASELVVGSVLEIRRHWIHVVGFLHRFWLLWYAYVVCNGRLSAILRAFPSSLSVIPCTRAPLWAFVARPVSENSDKSGARLTIAVLSSDDHRPFLSVALFGWHLKLNCTPINRFSTWGYTNTHGLMIS